MIVYGLGDRGSIPGVFGCDKFVFLFSFSSWRFVDCPRWCLGRSVTRNGPEVGMSITGLSTVYSCWWYVSFSSWRRLFLHFKRLAYLLRCENSRFVQIRSVSDRIKSKYRNSAISIALRKKLGSLVRNCSWLKILNKRCVSFQSIRALNNNMVNRKIRFQHQLSVRNLN